MLQFKYKFRLHNLYLNNSCHLNRQKNTSSVSRVKAGIYPTNPKTKDSRWLSTKEKKI